MPQNKFKDILEDNENLLWVSKPNAKVFYFSKLGWLAFFCIFAAAFFAPFLLFDGSGNLWGVLLPVAVILTAAVFIIRADYKNTFYAITQTRIIIRKGIIGTDYKMLELANIGAVEVNVGITDKLLNANTGTIRFGAPSAQLPANHGDNTTAFCFTGVEQPYELAKKIRSRNFS